jgi:hypothetical protein
MPFYTDPVTKMEHKFACNHCIRGHRSTNCSHNDRPLFYIRKKGRPVSQCTQCRALRKNRSLHTRCECPSRVANKGLGGSIDLADLPHGMTIESAKEFVDRLSMDQGLLPFPALKPRADRAQEDVETVIPTAAIVIDKIPSPLLLHRPLPRPQHPYPWVEVHRRTQWDFRQVSHHLHHLHIRSEIRFIHSTLHHTLQYHNLREYRRSVCFHNHINPSRRQ